MSSEGKIIMLVGRAAFIGMGCGLLGSMERADLMLKQDSTAQPCGAEFIRCCRGFVGARGGVDSGHTLIEAFGCMDWFAVWACRPPEQHC